eukprot:m.59015 g.59015  ORF g.59015 m.59015 type:complete len:1016 (-) comp13804_c0_seq1:15-3062(-)
MAIKGSLLVLLLLCSTIVAGPNSSHQIDSLQQWLSELKLQLPPFSLLNNTANVTRFDCQDLQFFQLQGNYTNHTYQLAFNDFGADCTLHLDVARLLNQSSIHADALGLLSAPTTSFQVAILTTHSDLPDMAVISQPDLNFSVDIDITDLPAIEESIFHLLKPVIDTDLSQTVNATVLTLLDDIAKDLTRLLLEMDAYIRPERHSTTPVPHTQAANELSLLGTTFLTSFYGLITDVFGDPSAQFSFNHLISLLTNNTNRLDITPAPANATLSLLQSGLLNLTLTVTQLELAQLDAFEYFDLKVLDPVTIATHINLADLALRMAFDYNVTVGDGLVGAPLVSKGELQLNLTNLNITGLVRVEVDGPCVAKLTEIAMYNPGCVQKCISSLAFDDVLMALAIAPNNVTNLTGDADIDQVVSSILEFATISFGSELNELVQAVLRRELLPVANLALSNYLLDQPTCNNEGMGSIQPTYYAGMVGGVLAIAICFYIKLLVWRDQQQSDYDSDESAALLGNRRFDSFTDTATHAPCLCVEPHVSSGLRYGMPVILVIVACSLVYAHTEVAGRVYPSIVYNGTTTNWSTLSVLQFIHTVHDMWFAKVYALDVTVLILSGIWPYLKLVLMLFCWVVPTTTITVSTRETFLRVLDVLGKWSLLDIYVSIMLVVGMHFHVPLDTPTRSSPTIVNMWVTPEPALFVYWGVIIVSLVLTHIMLHTHRACVEANLGVLPSITSRESLCNHVFKSGGQHFRFTIGGKVLVTLIILATAGAVVLGCITDAFTFQMKGLISWLYVQDGFSADRTYSLWSMFTDLPNANPNPNGVAIRFVQAFYLLFACAVPLIQQLVLAVLWLTPLAAKAQRRIYTAAEILFAWSGLEVYLLSIIMALLQLQPLTRFIIGHKCDTFNALLRTVFATELDGDDVCFDVTTKLNRGTFILLGCCTVNMLATFLVMRLCHQAVETRCLEKPSGTLVRTNSGTLTEYHLELDAKASQSCWTGCGLCFGIVQTAWETEDLISSSLNN